MFKKSKVVLVFALVLAMVMPAFANGTTEGSSTDANGVTTFSAFFSDPNANWNNMQDEVGKVITEKTGVKLDVEMAVGDPVQKLNLIAASGVYPDLISPKGDYAALVEAGALLDLTDLINEHAPNIKAILGDQINRLRHSNEDKSIYFIPTLDAINQYYYKVGGPFNLQLDVVKELGYPEIRTLEDYENAIKDYVAKYPTIDGQKTIGLSLLADDWRIMISTTNNAFLATGAPDDGEFYIDPETYEAMVHYKRPAEREYFRWLNHMNDIGLLDQESFVQKYDQYLAKIASGRVLAVIDQDWEIGQAVNSLKSEGKYERTYGRFPVTLTEDYKLPIFQQTGFSSAWGMGITTSCKDPVKAIKFLDFLASEEGEVLANWGIEGKHYNVVDGKRVIPADIMDQKVNNKNEFTKATGVGNYNISVRYGDGNIDSTGNYITTNYPELILEDYSDLEKKVLSNYNATFWKDLFPKEDEFPVKPWGAAWNIPIPNDSPITVFNQKEQDIVRQLIPEAILVSPEEFDAVYDKMLQRLEDIGASEIEKEYSEYIKKRIKLWNE